jgi:hypothetical protein
VAAPSLLRLPLVALAAASVLSCDSPTLPLPPPGLPNITAGADADHITLSSLCGGVEGNAVVVVLNDNPKVANDLAVSGARANDCGAWDATVYAHTGDVLEISQLFGTLASPPTQLQVP